MVFKNYNLKSKILVILTLVLVIILASWLWYTQKPNLNYQPYIADYLALVFDDQEIGNPRIEKLDFLLSDIKDLKNKNKKPVVVGFNQINENRNFKSLIDKANSIYIDIFSKQNLNQTNISKFKNVFNISQPFELKSYLTESNNLKIVYLASKNRIDFVFPGQNLEINGEPIGLNDFIVFSIENVIPESIVQIGNLVIDLVDYKDSFTTSIYNLNVNKILIYSIDNQNIIANDNYSFESGLWAKEVSDCSAYLAGESEISMSLSDTASQGVKSLELSSKNHFACTLNTFPVSLENDKLYKLSFDYKNIEGQEVQYYYNLSGLKDQIQEKFESFIITDNNWHTASHIIEPSIEQINNFSIYFYAPSNGVKPITNLYDNVRLISYSLTKQESAPKLNFPANYSLFNWVSLNEGDNLFSYSGSQVNLLESYNYSFESGPWTETAIDCSDYLSGEPELGMGLNNEASQGVKSLELSSKNHFACTLNTFPVSLENDKLYKLSFDYKNIAGQKIQYYYSLKNNLEQEQDEYKTIEVDNYNWNTYETLINPELDNIKELNFYLYAPSAGDEYIVNLYDNVRLEEFAPKEIYSYYLYNQKEIDQKNSQAQVFSNPISIWKENIQIKNIKDSFLLVYPKKYSNNWKLYSYQAQKNEPGIFSTILNKPINKNFHLQVDNYSNGWFIDPEVLCSEINDCIKNKDGSYNINLVAEHSSNKLSIFSLVFLTLIIIMLTISFIYGRKNQKNIYQPRA